MMAAPGIHDSWQRLALASGRLFSVPPCQAGLSSVLP
jgi:hypothetical protein